MITEAKVQEYAAEIAALVLLGAHLEGLRVLLRSYGQDLPAPVVAALSDHQQATDRLVNTIDAAVN